MTRKLSAIFALAFALVITSAIAHAQSQRTFVSTSGSDANTVSLCSNANPCRSFGAAISVTNSGGEIVVLTSGGYGPVEINKSIQIIAPTGVHAAITAFSGNAIRVNAAGATVALRGLTLNSLGASNGINVAAVGVLHIENCTVIGFSSNGINVGLAADGSEIFIKDTVVRNSNGHGIIIGTSMGTVRASIDGCRAENNNSAGFFASGRSRVTISNSVAAGNFDTGFFAFAGGFGTTAEMNAESCVSSNNNNGFFAAGSSGMATMRVTRSMATNNNTGFSRGDNGAFESLGDNLVDGNTTDIFGTITVIGGN